MPQVVSVSITPVILSALRFIYAYHHLTVKQVAEMVRMTPKAASDMLLRLERGQLLGFFGNVGIRGYGKTPKVYFLTRTGHRVLGEELAAIGEGLGPYRQIKMNTRWSPLMYHRIATVDVLSYVERDCTALKDYRLLGTLLEYRRERVGNRWRQETTDYVAEPHGADTRIVPDAGFALEHRASGKCALFLIEVDRGTTPLLSDQPETEVKSVVAKLGQYDRYLASRRVANRYPDLGTYSGFHLLFVTTSGARVANLRAAASASLNPAFHHLYRFSTLEAASHNLLHDAWLSRDHADHTTYRLIKGS
ncbi:replication-relaxation family protein [Yoonia sp. GPGPB17]|uniref:replication-relaxation family protein n=1 Tax=Yoonia sp. GPGPB17 TaxID=3026147 RepID=UPI0030C34CAE